MPFSVPFSVKDIVEFTGGRVVNALAVGGAVDEIRVRRPAPLAMSQPSDLAFFFSRAYEEELSSANPGVLITGNAFVKPLELASLSFWNRTAVVACEDPYLAMGILSEKFASSLSTVSHLDRVAARSVDLDHAGAGDLKPEVHPSAIVAPTAELEAGVKVGPHCVIEAGARIGRRTILYPRCYIGQKCVVGEDCVFFPGVVLYEWTHVGNRVRIHAGAILGADGFGYAPVRKGKQVIGHQKIYHLGNVVVEDDVEMGANSCVDRGTLGETRIGKNSKLDNHVHVGHNCRLDEGAVICGGTCLAGNASVGKYAYVGGMTGISNQVHVGEGGTVGAMTLVTKDVPPGGTAVGAPQRNYSEHFRAHAMLNQILGERRKK